MFVFTTALRKCAGGVAEQSSQTIFSLAYCMQSGDPASDAYNGWTILLKLLHEWVLSYLDGMNGVEDSCKDPCKTLLSRTMCRSNTTIYLFKGMTCLAILSNKWYEKDASLWNVFANIVSMILTSSGNSLSLYCANNRLFWHILASSVHSSHMYH